MCGCSFVHTRHFSFGKARLHTGQRRKNNACPGGLPVPLPRNAQKMRVSSCEWWTLERSITVTDNKYERSLPQWAYLLGHWPRTRNHNTEPQYIACTRTGYIESSAGTPQLFWKRILLSCLSQVGRHKVAVAKTNFIACAREIQKPRARAATTFSETETSSGPDRYAARYLA